jgi:hypothetical protein
MALNYLKDRKNILIFSIGIMLITMIPYLIGFASEDSGWYFTGFVIAVEDGNSYIAKMLTGSVGKWLFKTPYSSSEQQGIVAYLPYLILGKLAGGKALHTQLVVIYHAFRFLAGTLCILAGYDFISIYIKTRKWRWWAITLFTLGGGCGWILVILGQKNLLGSLPLDFISPESFGFLGILGFPHLSAGRAFFLWGLTSYLEKRSGYITGLYLLILGLFQPIYVFVAWAVMITHIALMITYSNFFIPKEERRSRKFEKEDIHNYLKTIIVSGPLMVYLAIMFLTDPFLQSWAGQNVLSSPHVLHYIIAYGLFLPLVVLGISQVFRDKPRSGMILIGWLVILPIMVYIPVSIQRRLAEGVWVVITVGVFIYLENLKLVPKFLTVLLYFAFPSTIFILVGSMVTANSLREPIFRPRDEVVMYYQLYEVAEVDSVVLSSYQIGNNLPAWIPMRVVLGHGPETANIETTKADIGIFFNPETKDETRLQIINKYHVNYVIGGPTEREMAGWDPVDSNVLKLIIESGEYAVYMPVLSP